MAAIFLRRNQLQWLALLAIAVVLPTVSLLWFMSRVIANEPTRKLIAKAQEKAVVVTFDRDIASVPANPCFEDIALVDERTLEITFRKDKVNAGEVLGALTADGLSIVDVTTRDPDLEDVFLSLVSAGQEAA